MKRHFNTVCVIMILILLSRMKLLKMWKLLRNALYIWIKLHDIDVSHALEYIYNVIKVLSTLFAKAGWKYFKSFRTSVINLKKIWIVDNRYKSLFHFLFRTYLGKLSKTWIGWPSTNIIRLATSWFRYKESIYVAMILLVMNQKLQQ